MNDAKLDTVFQLIDAANAEDPNQETWDGAAYPKELLYGQRMSDWLKRLRPEADELLQIAARAQHIRRWEIPRDSYPATREGYLRWRSFLYGFHGEKAAALMADAGYDAAAGERVKAILSKRGMKADSDVQLIEDVACLVFLEFYFPAFAATQDEAKLIPIVRKTWNKMSEEARQVALTLSFPETITPVLAQALA